MKKNEM